MGNGRREKPVMMEIKRRGTDVIANAKLRKAGVVQVGMRNIARCAISVATESFLAQSRAMMATARMVMVVIRHVV
jgi:hypothetical protein